MNLIPSALAGAIAASASAQLVRLAAVEDAHVEVLAAATNFGGAPELRLGTRFSSIPWLIFVRGYLKFDLGPAAGLGVPLRATLAWHQSSTEQSGAPILVSAQRVTASWTEMSVTWNTMPSDDPFVYATTPVGNGTPIGWLRWDVTPLVRDWLTATHPNHGVVLRLANEVVQNPT